MTTNKALRFATLADAGAWLRATSNFGLIHNCGNDFIIVQFAEGQTWAFTAADEMVLIPGW